MGSRKGPPGLGLVRPAPATLPLHSPFYGGHVVARLRRMAKKDGGNKSVLDLERYLNQPIKVKFSGGREVKGILKGHDAVANLVLDDVQEYLRDPEDPYKVIDETRSLGLVVARGTSVMLICPVDGTEEIANPFAPA